MSSSPREPQTATRQEYGPAPSWVERHSRLAGMPACLPYTSCPWWPTLYLPRHPAYPAPRPTPSTPAGLPYTSTARPASRPPSRPTLYLPYTSPQSPVPGHPPATPRRSAPARLPYTYPIPGDLPSGLPYTSPPTPPYRAGRTSQPAYPIPRPLSPRVPPQPSPPPAPTGLPYTPPPPRRRGLGRGQPSPADLPYTAAGPEEERKSERDKSALSSRPTYPIPQPGQKLKGKSERTSPPNSQHPRVLPVRLASCVAGGLSLGNLGEEGLTLSRS